MESAKTLDYLRHFREMFFVIVRAPEALGHSGDEFVEALYLADSQRFSRSYKH